MFDKCFLAFILGLTWPIRYLSYPTIHRLGRGLGLCLYYLSPKFRKRCLSNLSLASALHLSEIEIRRFAKASLQNLMITCLEYAKFDSEKKIDRIATCINPESADLFLRKNRSVIFFCGHQSNWEILFLEGTRRMSGLAIGRPIKNKHLYHWILRIREKFGGKIIAPSNAIREGLRWLKKNDFLGIVGDQGMPDSGYSNLFLGRRAWTSPIAAILSHRTGAPIIVATTERRQGKYFIHYSEPIFPNVEAPLNQEMDRLMQASLKMLEESIQKNPGEWLWSHNRWKQQTPEKIKSPFRHESILIILSEDHKGLLPYLSTFREIYPYEFITVLAPQEWKGAIDLKEAEILYYSHSNELFRRDFRFKLIFNFTSHGKIESHYKKLAAFNVFSLEKLQKLAGNQHPFAQMLKKAILKATP